MVSTLQGGQGPQPNAPSLVCVDEAWHDCADVCAGANEEDDDQKEGLEVEEGRLGEFQNIVQIRRSVQIGRPTYHLGMHGFIKLDKALAGRPVLIRGIAEVFNFAGARLLS
jgi:hypothetical protein